MSKRMRELSLVARVGSSQKSSHFARAAGVVDARCCRSPRAVAKESARKSSVSRRVRQYTMTNGRGRSGLSLSLFRWRRRGRGVHPDPFLPDAASRACAGRRARRSEVRARTAASGPVARGSPLCWPSSGPPSAQSKADAPAAGSGNAVRRRGVRAHGDRRFDRSAWPLSMHAVPWMQFATCFAPHLDGRFGVRGTSFSAHYQPYTLSVTVVHLRSRFLMSRGRRQIFGRPRWLTGSLALLR